MEKKMEKKMANLPEDMVIEEILTRLPVRSLLRFKCVSRSWHSIISDLAFANSHLQMSLSSGTKNRVFILSHPLRSIDYNQRDNPIITQLHISGYYARTLGSHNGFVCLLLIDSVILYNPSTRYYRLIVLPEPNEFNIDRSGFGFDTRSQEYKVVRQLRTDPRRFFLFSLTNIDQATAPQEIRCDIIVEKMDFGTSVNGSIHWLFERERNERILRLDLAHALFDELSTPHVLFDEFAAPDGPIRGNQPIMYIGLCVLGGCLSLTSREAGLSLGIWVMREYGVNTSWTKMMVIPIQVPSPYFLPLALRSRTEILLMISRTELVIYNSENQEGLLENVYHDEDNYDIEPTVYVESLVSPWRA